MKKFFKISAIVILSALILAAASILSFNIITKDAVLDDKKLYQAENNLTFYDDGGNEITSVSYNSNNKKIELSSLEKHTIDAFIASEDRTFYSHNGLNYKRMLKAAYKNLMARSFKEGASTISQQLIKNTHLTGDKTISRKLKEIRLTRKLEKKYSKDAILEMYLNTIYFGHNCYGIESAAEFYFDKKASELDLFESATLAGLLSSPNNYSPLKHPEKSAKRRNTVLKAMFDSKFISQKEYQNAVNSPLTVSQNKKTEKNSNADYINAVLDELEETEINFYDLTGNCKIYTYLNQNLQNNIENINFNTDNAVIVTNKKGGVEAFKSTIGYAKRQPGSTIKPIAVYAPSINDKIISPYTKILDEKIDYNGYSPENADGKYHGYVSVEDSIKMSYNVPAVKTLNSLTVRESEKYLNKMGITLENDEKNLALALGGMKNGLSIKQLADGYSVFLNSGFYSPSGFIREIVSDKGEIIYKQQNLRTSVFSVGTCSLTNKMLMETSKSGTAKKLKDYTYDLASKTGTCGTENGNTDAYDVSYTSEHCIAVWLGDKDNKKLNITGGKECCETVKEILNGLYESHIPKPLDTESGTQNINIDAEEYYNNNRVILADKISPLLNVLTVKTLKGNIPKDVSTKFSSPTISLPKISVENNCVSIELCQTKYYKYLVKRSKNGKNETIYDGKWKKIITDAPENGVYIYSVTPYFEDKLNLVSGEEIKLPAVNIGQGVSPPQTQIPDIAEKDWYNM